MVECEVPRKRGRWGSFYSRKCGVKSPPDEGNRWFSACTLYRHRVCLPTECGALEDNRNGTADFLGKACLTAGSSRQDSSSLVVGFSASPNQSSGVEDNGAGYDVQRVKDDSLGSDPDSFSNVETRNDTYVLENKASLKSEVIASFCNENEHDMGLNDGIANGVTPSNLNTTVMLEDIAVGFDDGDRKIAGVTVACKLLEVSETRMLYGEGAFWSTQDGGVSNDQSSYSREKEESAHSTVVDIWSQVRGDQVVILPSTNECMNEERSIRIEDVDQAQAIQLKRNPEETQDRSNDSITGKNADERNRESSPLLKEGRGCLDKGVIQSKSVADSDGFTPQNCQLDAHELVDHHNGALRTGPILRSRRICLETSIATSVLKKHQRRLSTSLSFKGTITRRTNFMDTKFRKRVVKGLLEDYLKVWTDKNMQAGALESEHCLPFLVHAPRRVECYQCKALVSSGKEVLCTVLNCRRAFHLVCAKNLQGHSWSKKREFKCPQHVCMACGSRGRLWRCVRCPVAVHKACSPWPEAMTLLRDTPGQAVCWRHHEDWRLDHKCKDRTSNIKEAFHRLPIPYSMEDFKIERHFWKDVMGNENEPPPYVHVRRNVFLIKKKRDDTDDGVGCSCGRDAVVCAENCECRVQSMSCSKACRCSELCTNKPFRKEKKIKLVKTTFCGWGAEAAEVIKRGEFVIEYIGEVIDDALCEERLWEMKYRGVHNFYMCEIGKDFIIDATFKGNPSRFLNHSCDPNCKLEKWRVDGETRVGIFAAKDIMVGEPLTYDYRFIQFGPNVKCCCGAANCQGDLGEPFGMNGVKNGSTQGVNGESFGNNAARTPILQILEWGCKRKRSY